MAFLPFVAEKVIEMFYHIIKNEDLQDDDDEDNTKVPDINIDNKQTSLQKKGGVLKNKIKFVSKQLKMQRLLREKSEDIIEIKEKANNHKQPFGILQEGSEAIEQFKKAKTTDMKNERRPT